MADINRCILVGRLTRDIELRYSASGVAVGRLSLALNRRVQKDQQWVNESHFFDIVVFGKIAEALKNYLVKGKQLAIEGSLRQNQWEVEGQKRSKVEIVAENIQLLSFDGPGKSNQNSTTENSSYRPAETASSGAGQDSYMDEDLSDDDIPF